MTAFDLVIRGGRLVSAADIQTADLGVRGGRIAAIGQDLGAGAEEVDAGGLMVLPGGVDSHVHLDQPFSSGAEIADDYASGTASALAGGTTTVLTFAVQARGQSFRAAIDDHAARAARARCDHGFHLLVTDPTEDALLRELPALAAEGHRSIKIFTTNSTRLGDPDILRVLAAARANGMLVCVHCENDALIAHLTAALRAQGRTRPADFPLSKPMLAEREAVHRLVTFAEALDAPIQIFHVSGAGPADEIARARARGAPVWAETCTQYLVFTAADLDRPGMEGAKLVFAPAPRTEADRAALWDRIRDGTIQMISSDHSPLRFGGPTGKLFAGAEPRFDQIPNGVPGLAARLPVVFSEGVAQGRIDPRGFVDLVATAPARLFGLYPRKGTLAVGADADLVLWDPDATRTLTNADMHHGSDYTPYEGMSVTGAPVRVYLRGRTAFAEGEVLAAPGDGRFVPRPPNDALRPPGRFAAGFDPAATP